MMEACLNASLWVTEEAKATALCSRDGVKNDSERASVAFTKGSTAVSRVIKVTLNKLKSKTKTVVFFVFFKITQSKVYASAALN